MKISEKIKAGITWTELCHFAVKTEEELEEYKRLSAAAYQTIKKLEYKNNELEKELNLLYYQVDQLDQRY